MIPPIGSHQARRINKMKIPRISGLVLAALCCMTLLIAAASAEMAPAQGPDQAQNQNRVQWYSPGHEGDPAPGNMTEFQGNLTSPPPLPENWTGDRTEQGDIRYHQGNLTDPGNWSGYASDQERAMNTAPENEQQNNKESIIEEFLAWLSSHFKS